MVIHHFNRIIKNKWVWGVFAVLISAFFAFDFIFDGRSDSRGPDGAGKLAGETVSRVQFDNARMDVSAEIRLLSGRDVSIASPQFNKMIWSRLVLLKVAADMSLNVSDEDVQAAIAQKFSDPQTGAFNNEAFYGAIRQNLNWPPERFEAFVRRQIQLQRVLSVAEASNWVSPLEISGGVRDATDKMTVRIARFQQTNAASIKLDDAAFKAYYESHTNSFTLPALTAVQYVRVPLKAAEIKATDEELRAHYEDTINNYGTNAFETVKSQVESDFRRVKQLEAVEDACTPTYNEVAAALGNALADSSIDQFAARAQEVLAKNGLAAAGKLDVKTSGRFSISGQKFVKDFMVGIDSVLPECKEFASTVSDLDAKEPSARFRMIAGSNAVYVVGLAEKLCTTEPRTLAYEEITNNASIRAEALADLKEQDFKKGVDKVRETVLADLKKTSKFDPKLFGGANVSTSITFVAQNAMRSGAFPDAYSIAPVAMRLAKGELSELIPTGLPGHGAVVYVEDRQPGDAAAGARAQFKARILQERDHQDGIFVLERMMQPQVRAWCEANMARLGVQPSEWASMEKRDSDDGEDSAD